ncbi:MAG: carboxypeptidase-like regulatory domain-containing protein, partial [Massilibacteroides sp.]|nr:carboxypeptidase-like regulatory domain-containing protein [Massilibacteroides sp.]
MKKHIKKLTLVGICLILFQIQLVFAAGQMITLNITKGSMSEIFKEIEKQSEYKFFYNNEQINLSIPVDVNVKADAIEDVLKQIFSGTDITYKIINNHIVLTNSTQTQIKRTSQATAQQTKTIKGKVVDFQGEPLIGVNVVLKGTTNGTITDVEGNFEISNIPDNAVLVFSYIGHHTQEIAVNGRSTVNVTLVEDTQKLEEVVVVGYG